MIAVTAYSSLQSLLGLGLGEAHGNNHHNGFRVDLRTASGCRLASRHREWRCKVYDIQIDTSSDKTHTG